ncbi:hypothetical protein K3756_13980 [Sulfitobacter sp. S190]|nr:hypothetical protein K3756_13980 [Sulfitobacter sp. S190]
MTRAAGSGCMGVGSQDCTHDD